MIFFCWPLWRQGWQFYGGEDRLQKEVALGTLGASQGTVRVHTRTVASVWWWGQDRVLKEKAFFFSLFVNFLPSAAGLPDLPGGQCTKGKY